MSTACIQPSHSFQALGRRRVEAAFDAGRVSSDGGLLLLREAAEAIGLFSMLANCFVNHLDQRRVERSVKQLVAQRVLALAAGYEDLNDHDTLRADPLLALAVGKEDVFGEDRARARDRGSALAGHSTLNRIELAPATLDSARRDLKIIHKPEAIENLFVDIALDAHPKAPKRIILDVDTTDDPLHGRQEGRFFHGYYRSYCYLPLYIFWGDHLLAAKLRTAESTDIPGVVAEFERVVGRIRRRWPEVEIWIRGDSGFCRDELLSWCERTERVEYIIGQARNVRLQKEIHTEMEEVVAEVKEGGEAVRRFSELRYRTLDSWSCERRVIAKVEALVGKRNPRFVVTSLTKEQVNAKTLYEELYCARGDMENRIKEQQLGMFADRLSAHTLRANQLRLWLSGLAYVLVDALRRIGLKGTEMARAQVWTIRTRLLKVGCLVRRSVRRFRIALSSAFPLQAIWATAIKQLHLSAPGVF